FDDFGMRATCRELVTTKLTKTPLKLGSTHEISPVFTHSLGRRPSYLYVTSSSRIGRSCGRFSPSPTTAAPTHSSARPPSLLRSPRNERAALAQLRCGCLDLRQHRRVLGIEQDTDAARLRNHLVQKLRPLGIEFGTKDAYPSRVPAWPGLARLATSPL